MLSLSRFAVKNDVFASLPRNRHLLLLLKQSIGILSDKEKCMALFKSPGADCVASFNQIFNDAHLACRMTGGRQHEPHFVRHLISAQTIHALNNATADLYEARRNTVSFRGAFLHNSPYASFDAGGAQRCRRELADAMFVVYVTAPDSDGIHTIVRRAACMLMFKKSSNRTPSTFNFDPHAGVPPVGTDQEQFYLFNMWPSFELQTGRRKTPKKHGTFNIASPASPNGAAIHDVGKFAVVWHSTAGTTSKWSVGGSQIHWLAGEPTPRVVMPPSHTSLGKLLDDFIDGAQNAGRDFNPSTQTTGDWNNLMGTLLGYPVAGPVKPHTVRPNVHSILKDATWGNQFREVNPAAVGLMVSGGSTGMSFFESVDIVRSTFAQHSRDSVSSGALERSYFAKNYPYLLHRMTKLPYFINPNGPTNGEEDATPFPILIATVTSFDHQDK